VFEKAIKRAVSEAMAAAIAELTPQLQLLVKRTVQELFEADPEVRNLIRRTVKEHLEVMRDELVALDESNRALSDRLVDFFGDFDELQKRIAVLEKAVAGTPPYSSAPTASRAPLQIGEGKDGSSGDAPDDREG
jgi:hypothetical protein